MKNIKLSPSPVNLRRRTLVTAIAGIAALGLTGCGGDSNSSSADPIDNEPLPDTEPDLEPDLQPEDLYPTSGTHNPRGIHVSFVDDPYETRTVTWFTDGEDTPTLFARYTQDASIFDEYGNPTIPLDKSAVSEESDTFGVDAKTQRATLTDLDPDLPIFYQVGSDMGGWSRIYELSAMPRENWTFVHYGDQGTNANALKVHNKLLNHKKDLCLIAGDLSYANGDQPIWDTWFDQNQPHFASTVMLAAAGNHENKDGSLLETAGAFKTRLSQPKPDISVLASNPGSTFYGFDLNRVHFLITSSGTLIEDFSLPSELVNMEVDLSKAAIRRLKGEIDFIVVVQHYPLWTDQLGRSPANFDLVLLQEQILLRYGVDMLLVGHDHIYQRSAPMAQGYKNQLGYVQVLAGTGGASVRLFDENGPQSWSESEFVGIGFVSYDVEPGVIKANFWGASPEGLEDEKRQIVSEPFSIRDTFEVKKRSLLDIQSAAVEPRKPDVLLKDYELVAKSTKRRNYAHDKEHG
jgi:hypothetical protein